MHIDYWQISEAFLFGGIDYDKEPTHRWVLPTVTVQVDASYENLFPDLAAIT